MLSSLPISTIPLAASGGAPLGLSVVVALPAWTLSALLTGVTPRETAYDDMTFAALVAEARGVLADRRDTHRYSDDDLLRYANDALLALSLVRPELFTHTIDHTCTPGAEQALSEPACRAIVELPALRRSSKDALDRVQPGWTRDAPAAAIEWMPAPGQPNKFYLYPPSDAGQVVTVVYSKAPKPYRLPDVFPILHSFWPPVLAYVIGMAESRDDPHVLSGRAAQFLSAFNGMTQVATPDG